MLLQILYVKFNKYFRLNTEKSEKLLKIGCQITSEIIEKIMSKL